MLTDMVRTDSHQLRAVAGDSPGAGAVKVVARAHKTLIWERTRQVQRLRHQLREYFPAALEAFDDLDAPDALELLGNAPDPANRTIGTEESIDLTALDLHREVAHDLAAAEGFGQAMDVDGDLGCRRGCAGHCSGPRETLTGWPTRRCSGRSGRASIRNTSLERSSML